MKNKTKIIIGSTGVIAIGASVITPIMLLNKKTKINDGGKVNDPTPIDDDKQNEVKLLPDILKSAISNLNDDQMKIIDEKSEIISGYSHEVFKEGFTAEYVLNKIKNKLLANVSSELKEKLSTKNIKIELDDSKDRGLIKISILDNNGDKIVELNAKNYKYIEEFALDKYLNENLRKVINFSKSPKDNENIVKDFIDNHKYMKDLKDDIYKNPSQYIENYSLEINDSEIKIIFKTIKNHSFSYTLNGFIVPGSAEIENTIKGDIDLNGLKNDDGNTLASDITVDNILDILKNNLTEDASKKLLESMKDDFELVANDQTGELNVKFHFKDKTIEWNISNFLKLLDDTSITQSNVDNFILHPKSYVNVSTIETKVFEGKTIPDGFVFPKAINIIKLQAFFKATFAGSFTLPEGVTTLGGSAFESATFNADVTLPDSLEDIGNWTFVRSTWNQGALLTKLPDNLKKLHGGSLEKNDQTNDFDPIPLADNFTLANTKLERIEDGGRLREAGIFNGYVLPANFKLPDTIKYIGRYAFKDADFSQLPNQKLVIPNHDVEIHFESGLNDNNATLIYDSNTRITKLNSFSADKFLENPKDLIFKNLTTIGGSTFSQKTIPDGFVFPKTIKKIEMSAFVYATFAGSFTLPEGIIELGDYAFSGATFNSDVTLPDSIEDIGHYTFYQSIWKNSAVLTKLPNSLKSIKVDSLEIDRASQPIPLADDFTLENTMIKSIEDHIGNYDSGVFYKYKLPANFKLPHTIEYIGQWAFKDADFSQLPNGKLLIPYNARLHSQSGLEDHWAYDKSSKLTILTSSFVDEFLNNFTDKKFSNITTLDSQIFKNKTIPDGFSFPKTIKHIRTKAFFKATFAGSFTLPEGVTTLGVSAFESATFNANVTLPNSIEDIGNYAFVRSTWNQGALLTKLPDNLKKLHGGSLEKNDQTNDFDPIPLADDFTLANTKLERIEDADEYDEGTFNGYVLPANFKLPDTIKYIGKYAFKDADFSQLPNQKLVIPNHDVEIHLESGLTDANISYAKTPTSKANNAQIKSQLLRSKNTNYKKDEDINTIY